MSEEDPNPKKDIWYYGDKFFDFVDTDTFTYISVGLLIIGVLLGLLLDIL